MSLKCGKSEKRVLFRASGKSKKSLSPSNTSARARVRNVSCPISQKAVEASLLSECNYCLLSGNNT